MSIITKRGDLGRTDLLFGDSIRKHEFRVEVIGTVDELNAALGIARSTSSSEEWVCTIDQVQQKLIILMGLLATLPEKVARYEEQFGSITDEDVKWLEAEAVKYEGKIVQMDLKWATPGAEHSHTRAALDFARTIARKSERVVYTLAVREGGIPSPVNIFLNRLSDLLWIMARSAT